MPLLDHFHPPLSRLHSWESFHSNWATRLADAINAQLPPDFFAEEWCRDPDSFQVRVLRSTSSSPVTVGVLDLISPATKSDASQRSSFAVGRREALRSEIGVVVVDIVSNRSGNIHNEVVGELTDDPGSRFVEDVSMYAAAYHVRWDDSGSKMESWHHRLLLGERLPTLPLWFRYNAAVPVDLEATYSEACRRRRII